VFQLNNSAYKDIYEIKVCSVVTKFSFSSLVEIPKEHKAELSCSGFPLSKESSRYM